MIAYEREKLKDQLLQWGYLRHRVERMPPWALLSCYQVEKSKRAGELSGTRPSHRGQDPFLHSAILSEIWANKLVKTARKKMVRGFK